MVGVSRAIVGVDCSDLDSHVRSFLFNFELIDLERLIHNAVAAEHSGDSSSQKVRSATNMALASLCNLCSENVKGRGETEACWG